MRITKWVAMGLLIGLAASGSAFAQSYLPTGIQQNVPVATVTGGGWTECFRETFDKDTTSIASATSGCTGPQLMMACRPTGDATLTVLAQAPKTDVMFDTGTDTTTVHAANGTNWYFNSGRSWGFANAAVNKNSCDLSGGAQRMCMHASGGRVDAGYRCGDTTALNNSAAYERILYTRAAPAAAPASIPTLSEWGLILLSAALALYGLARMQRRR